MSYTRTRVFLGAEADEEADIVPLEFPPTVHSPAQIRAYADMMIGLVNQMEQEKIASCNRLPGLRRKRCKQRATNRVNRQRSRLTGAVLHAMRRALGGGFVAWAQGTGDAVGKAIGAGTGLSSVTGAFSMPAQTPPGYRPPPPTAEERRLMAGALHPWVIPAAVGGGVLLLTTVVVLATRRKRSTMAANRRRR